YRARANPIASASLRIQRGTTGAAIGLLALLLELGPGNELVDLGRGPARAARAVEANRGFRPHRSPIVISTFEEGFHGAGVSDCIGDAGRCCTETPRCCEFGGCLGGPWLFALSRGSQRRGSGRFSARRRGRGDYRRRADLRLGPRDLSGLEHSGR